MIEFAWPLVALALPLPLIAWGLLPRVRHQEAALQVPFYAMAASLNDAESTRSTFSRVRLAMLVLGVWGVILWLRGRIDKPGLFHWAAVPGGALGFIAVITGWMVAEVGRQPYTVYASEGFVGLRTADSVAPVSTGQVATSLLVFMVVYAIIFTAGTIYMARIATRGFVEEPPEPPQPERRAPGTAMGAVDELAELPPEIADAYRRAN